MTSFAPTLTDAALQDELDQRGYVVVPLLDADEVAELRDFYRSAVAAGEINPEGAYDPTYAEFSVVHSHPEFRALAFERIVEVVGPRTAELLEPHRPLVANYVNKPPGTGIVPMHQNWYVVDEAHHRSVSVWIALVDCSADNGTLQFLPGSHRALREPRGMWAYEAFADVIEPSLEVVEISAGQAIVLDDAVVPSPPPNRTAADRLAIQLIMVPDQVPALFCERVGEHDDRYEVDVWAVEPPFFWNFWHGVGDPQHGSVVRHIEVSSHRFDAEDVSTRLAVGPR